MKILPDPQAFDGSAARNLHPPASDRRRSHRRSERVTAWLSNATAGTTSSGRTVIVEDLSLHGVGFTTTRPCSVGDCHWILVTQGAMRLSTRVRIASVRQAEEGEWICGGEFF